MRSLSRLAVLAAFTACWQSATARRDVPPVADRLAFLPATAEIVGGFDGNRARASALWRQYGPKLFGTTPELVDEFKASCGFDPVAALDSVAFALVDLDADPLEVVVVVRGYPKKATLACIRDHAPPDSSPVFTGDTVTIDASGTPIALQFVDDTTAIIASGPAATPAAIAQLIARGAPLRASPGFTERFARIDHAQAVWFVVQPVAGRDPARTQPAAVFGTVDVGALVTVTAHIEMRTAEDAATLAASDPAEVTSAKASFTRFGVKTHGRFIDLDVAATAPQLVELVTKLFRGFMGGD